MKKLLFLSIISLCIVSCNTNVDDKSSHSDSIITDSVLVENNIIAESDSFMYVEDIFQIKSDLELEQKFGKENITIDTIWGAEGMFYMGTKIFARTPKEIIISWDDTLKHNKITSCTVNCGYDVETGTLSLSKFWKSKTGISLGTSLKELVELNGKDFTFLGLGWDYGGELISWNKGKLETGKITVTLGTSSYDNLPKAYEKIIGDQEFSSSNPNAKELNPVVVVFSAINF